MVRSAWRLLEVTLRRCRISTVRRMEVAVVVMLAQAAIVTFRYGTVSICSRRANVRRVRRRIG